MKSFRPTQMRPLGLGFLVVAMATLLAGCQEEVITSNTHTTRQNLTRYHSDICFTSLDRTSIPSVVTGTGPDASPTVLAGFNSVWAPGAPPIACDRLNVAVGQGVFNFAVSNLRTRVPALPSPFRGALLEITSFTPVGGNPAVIEAVPWNWPANTGWLGSPGSIHTTCAFKVKAVTERWLPGAAGWGQPIVTTRELNHPARSTITVPMRGPVSLDVAAEIGPLFEAGLNGNGFAIEPVDVDNKSSNHCAGQFTVRLRTFHGPD